MSFTQLTQYRLATFILDYFILDYFYLTTLTYLVYQLSRSKSVYIKSTTSKNANGIAFDGVVEV